MAGYEYSNARLRAMKSSLLNRDDLQGLVETRLLDQFLRTLAQTDYRESVKATPVITGELDALNAVLSHNMQRTFRKVRRMFEPEQQQIVAVVFEAYDVHNIKAILRGLHNNAAPEAIRDAQLPAGEISANMLLLLAQASSWREALDLMATMRLPIARPLLTIRTRHPNAPAEQFELALDHWYFSRAVETSKQVPREARLLASAIAMDADLANLITVLRLAHWPSERAAIQTHLGVDNTAALLVGPGSLSPARLSLAAEQTTVEAAVELLTATRYGTALEAGLASYRRSHRFSDLERSLRRYRLTTFASFIRQDPLGIGVLLGYLALKINEIGNLRWLAHGIDLGLPVQTLSNELELLA